MTVADTSYFIDLMRHDAGAVRCLDAFAAEGWPLHAPTVVVHELHHGLARGRRPVEEWARIQSALAGLTTLDLDPEAARIGGQIDGALRSTGQQVGSQDCMIAGIALRHGMAVLTRNVEDFGRIQGLDVVTY